MNKIRKMRNRLEQEASVNDTRRTYTANTGYTKKVYYWAGRLQEAVESHDYKELYEANKSLQYFVGRQKEWLMLQIEKVNFTADEATLARRYKSKINRK